MFYSSDNEEVVCTIAMVSVWMEEIPKVRVSAAGLALNRKRIFSNKTRNIQEDYFINDTEPRLDGGIGSRNTEAEFESIFRMPRSVVDDLFVSISVDDYFYLCSDTTGKPGAHPLRKVNLRSGSLATIVSYAVEEYRSLRECFSRKILCCKETKTAVLPFIYSERSL